jgi:hypothetical protein
MKCFDTVLMLVVAAVVLVAEPAHALPALRIPGAVSKMAVDTSADAPAIKLPQKTSGQRCLRSNQ